MHKLEEMDPVYSLGISFCNWSDSKCLYVLKFCTQRNQEDLILEKQIVSLLFWFSVYSFPMLVVMSSSMFIILFFPVLYNVTVLMVSAVHKILQYFLYPYQVSVTLKHEDLNIFLKIIVISL